MNLLCCLGERSHLSDTQHREANIVQGHYIYMEDLRALQECKHDPMPTGIPRAIVSLLSENAEKWEAALRGHPDKEFMAYIVEGLRHGFRIGFDYAKHRCIPARDNLPSVTTHQVVVQEYLHRECEAGWVVGPLPPCLQICR